VHVTRYYFFGDTRSNQPLVELQKCLETDDPPVYVSFGSMANRDAERIDIAIQESLAKTNNRGIILSGWGGLRNQVNDKLFYLDAVPHD